MVRKKKLVFAHFLDLLNFNNQCAFNFMQIMHHIIIIDRLKVTFFLPPKILNYFVCFADVMSVYKNTYAGILSNRKGKKMKIVIFCAFMNNIVYTRNKWSVFKAWTLMNPNLSRVSSRKQHTVWKQLFRQQIKNLFRLTAPTRNPVDIPFHHQILERIQIVNFFAHICRQLDSKK